MDGARPNDAMETSEVSDGGSVWSTFLSSINNVGLSDVDENKKKNFQTASGGNAQSPLLPAAAKIGHFSVVGSAGSNMRLNRVHNARTFACMCVSPIAWWGGR